MTKKSNSSTPKPSRQLTPLEISANRLTESLRASGHTVVNKGASIMTGSQVHFVPSARQSAPKKECPRCLWTSTLDHLGRCRACWGDIFGLCDECENILEEDGGCSICNGEDKSNDQAV